MKRLLISILFFLCISTCLNAQYVRPDGDATSQSQPSAAPSGQGTKPDDKYNFWSHTSFGGNLSLLFGSVTYIIVAPLLNYHFNKNFVLGVGPFYQYYSILEPPVEFSSSVYGGRAVGMVFLPDKLSNIFLQGEYDLLNVPDFYTYTNDIRTTIGIPLIGGGYRQPAGDNAYFTLAILFDLSNSRLSPYYSGSSSFPLVFAGIDIGL